MEWKISYSMESGEEGPILSVLNKEKQEWIHEEDSLCFARNQVRERLSIQELEDIITSIENQALPLLAVIDDESITKEYIPAFKGISNKARQTILVKLNQLTEYHLRMLEL